jgi:predicted membrane metal-binding protein
MTRFSGYVILLLATAGMLVLGYAYALWTAVYLPADHVSHHLSPTPVTLEGQVLRLAKVGPNRTALDLSARALTAETAGVPVSGRVRVTAYDFEPMVEAGDIVRIHHLRLRRPSGFRNPGAFDYGRYLARRGYSGPVVLDEVGNYNGDGFGNSVEWTREMIDYARRWVERRQGSGVVAFNWRWSDPNTLQSPEDGELTEWGRIFVERFLERSDA